MDSFDKFLPVEEIPLELEIAVYKAENQNTGHFYIGATKQLRTRINAHIHTLMNNDHNSGGGTDLFQKAYNWDQDFQFTAMPVETREEAFKIEKELIQKHRGNPLCVNMKDAVPSAPVTEATRAKISEASRSHWQDPEYRAKVTDSLKIVSQSPDRRKLLSEYSKARWKDPEQRANMEQYLRSPEFKAIISATSTGRIDTEETRLKRSQTKKGIPQSPELVEKRVAPLRGRTRSPETVEACKAGAHRRVTEMSENDKAARLERIAEASKKGAEKVKRSVVYNGVQYESVSAVLRDIGGSSATLYKKLKAQGYEVQK